MLPQMWHGRPARDGSAGIPACTPCWERKHPCLHTVLGAQASLPAHRAGSAGILACLFLRRFLGEVCRQGCLRSRSKSNPKAKAVLKVMRRAQPDRLDGHNWVVAEGNNDITHVNSEYRVT